MRLLSWDDVDRLTGKSVPITAADREFLKSLIERYGDQALRAVGLAHRDIPAAEIASNTQTLCPEDLEHDLVLDAIVVSGPFLVMAGRVLVKIEMEVNCLGRKS